MAVAYSQDLRDRVLAAYDRGMTTGQVAETFRVSKAWARRVKQRRNEHGETTPRKSSGAPPRRIDRQRLAELVRQQPDATLGELRERLGCVCGEPAISMALTAMGFSFKKRRSTRPSRTGPTSPSSAIAGSRCSSGWPPAG